MGKNWQNQKDLEDKAVEGLKVIDLSWVIVGPFTSKYLADHGATVIRIESATKPDISRTNPAFKENVPGLNRSVFNASFNSNKLSLSLNLRHPKGLEIALRLVEWADILIEGFTPGVAEKLGLGYEDVCKVNPKIIMLSTSAYGKGGPYSSLPTYGTQLMGQAGIFHLTGWPDRGPVEAYGAYTDFVAPRFQVAVLMAALAYRQRTGKGVYLDSSQYEASLQLLSPLLLDYLVNDRVASRNGNRCPYAAPHGVYRCLGEDRWCTIAIFSDEEWKRFCQVIGNLEWSKDPKFATLLGRREHEHDLDRLVEKWTSNLTAEEIMQKMQAAGVEAGVVHDIEGVFKDPQLDYYKYFETIEHGEIGKYTAQNVGFVMSKTPRKIEYPAPLLGQDTVYVCTQILGMSDDEFTNLFAEGVFD
jgi:benzylsuccinate CoA-transferase BbsF subunit